jgi:hypothetical protein
MGRAQRNPSPPAPSADGFRERLNPSYGAAESRQRVLHSLSTALSKPGTLLYPAPNEVEEIMRTIFGGLFATLLGLFVLSDGAAAQGKVTIAVACAICRPCWQNSSVNSIAPAWPSSWSI